MDAHDLAEILRMLNGTRQNWVVHIALPETEKVGSGEPLEAQLFFIEGKVTACHVRSGVDGRMLVTGEEAMRWLASLGPLVWNLEAFTPQQASLLVPRGSPVVLSPSTVVPRHIGQVERGMINSWSRKQRQIFALIDGRRSIERIAVILCQPPKFVEDVVNDLQSKGVIVLD